MPDPITPQKFAAVLAHLGASKFVEGGIPLPDGQAVATAVNESAELQIVVFISRYTGPLRIDPSILEKIALLNTSQGSTECPLGTEPSASVLSAVQKRILDVLDGETVGRKGTWIAAKIGAKYGGWFRQSLADLMKAGLLERDSRGYRLKRAA